MQVKFLTKPVELAYGVGVISRLVLRFSKSCPACMCVKDRSIEKVTMTIFSGIPSLLEKAASAPTSKGVRFLKGGVVYAYFSYDQLFRKAQSFSQHLSEFYKFQPLERVAVALPSSPDFIIAFFGVLMAGAVPVPLPHLGRFTAMARYIERMRGAVTQSKIRYLVTTEYAFNKIESGFSFLSDFNIGWIPVEPEKITPRVPSNTQRDTFSLDAPALVQYTSGSTSNPKGILLTHRQLMANLKAISTGLSLCPNDICCSWLPLFHDMGLIGCLLGSINSNIDLLLMEPLEFVRNPMNWLKPIEEFKATVTSAPNSAYLRCVQKVSPDEAMCLDLSSWRIAMNGSEFVDSTTMDRFSDHFRNANFDANAFLPVYGMAEASLAVTFPPLHKNYSAVCLERGMLSKKIIDVLPESVARRDNNRYTLVTSVGKAATGIEIQILSEEHKLHANEEILGEICIRGSSVTNGYDSDFVNITQSMVDGWLKTGDIGFFYKEELYIIGRVKDVIVLNGENFHAHDIEIVSEKAAGSECGEVMAFGLRNNGSEELIIFTAVSKTLDSYKHPKIENRIRSALFESFGVTPSEIIFLTKEKLPRTSSGKVQRYKGADLYLKYRCNQLSKESYSALPI